MKRFITRHADKIIGVLSGFDRLVFRGTLRQLSYTAGMMVFLNVRRVLLTRFGSFAEECTRRLKEASCQRARDQHRPIQYLRSTRIDKELTARDIASEDRVTQGLIAVLSTLETCMSYEIHRNRERKRLELQPAIRKGLHLYHYLIDPVFGFMNARIQTWFPFSIQICINGREWLAREMDRAGIGYERRENCFVRIDDIQRAQALMSRQLKTPWIHHLDRIARMLNPAHAEIFRGFNARYYWSIHQSEWATDLMFKRASDLARITPALMQHGIISFGSADVMRFLGGKVHGGFRGEIITDFKDRPEGRRIKHAVDLNSVKLYDKQGSVLRTETTINNPAPFKVFRRPEGRPASDRRWCAMRKGVADTARRARVSQASNERYLDAQAAADTSTPLRILLDGITQRVHWKARRHRALRPWFSDDLTLLQAVNRGEFTLNGFRNRDLRPLLFEQSAATPTEAKRRTAKISRLLRLLRAHRLVRRVPRTHRYLVTDRGREIITAILTTQTLTLQKLTQTAA